MHIRKQKTHLLYLYAGCNFRCCFCMAHDYIIGAGRQNFSAFQKELDKVKEQGYVNVDIGGSEPTLYPRLFDLVRLIHAKGLNPMLCTNGAKFSDPIYVKSLSQLRPLGFEVSVHSHKADTFDLTTGVKGSFKKVLSGMRNLRKYLRFYPDDEERNFLAANIVVTRHNYAQLPMITRFLRDEGVMILKFSQLYVSGRVYRHPELLVETSLITPYLEKALAYAKAHRMYYSIDRLPVCIAPSYAKHFVSYESHPFSMKLSICEGCKFKSKCCGITKTQLMAEYKDKLIGHFARFNNGFFTKEDEKFLKMMGGKKTGASNIHA